MTRLDPCDSLKRPISAGVDKATVVATCSLLYLALRPLPPLARARALQLCEVLFRALGPGVLVYYDDWLPCRSVTHHTLASPGLAVDSYPPIPGALGRKPWLPDG